MADKIHPPAVDTRRSTKIEALLRRYPDLDTDEIAELTAFFSNGPILEQGLIAGNEALRPNLERFKRDHARHFSPRLAHYLIALASAALFIGACVYLWDWGVAG